MSRKCLAVTVAAVVLAVPTFADVPDGKGGRTAAWKVNTPAVAPAAAHDCCRLVVTPPAQDVVASPAELKAVGHAAWVGRGDVAPAAVACYKRFAYRPATAPSPVEMKTLGHVALRTAPRTGGAKTCCESGRCPMRPRASASR